MEIMLDFTFLLMTILEEARHYLIIIEHDPQIYEDAGEPPSFCMHLKDPHAYWEMIQALEDQSRVEECSFNAPSVLSRATGSTLAEKWPRRSRSKPATPPSFTMWTSGRSKAI